MMHSDHTIRVQGHASMIELETPGYTSHPVAPPRDPPPPRGQSDRYSVAAGKSKDNLPMRASSAGSKRYSVIHLGPGRGSLVKRVSTVANITTVVDEVDVPHEIIDVLAHNMPRLLQLVAHWSNRTGEVALSEFERVMHTLGVRYTPSQLQRLFRVLDADANGRVSLEELLLLKMAIDNDVTELPARPNHDDDDDFLPRSDANWKPAEDRPVVLKIDHVDKVEKKKSAFGFFAFAKPFFAAIWKAELRPHHALDLEQSWGKHARGKATVHARMRICKRPLMDLDEFIRLVRSLQKGVGPAPASQGHRGSRSEPEIRAAFRHFATSHGETFDAKNTGRLDDRELRQALRELGLDAGDPKVGPDFYVRLSLTPKRGSLQGERSRFVYQAGPTAGGVDGFCEHVKSELNDAAERACDEMGALLTEVRQLDLKLQEVRLIHNVGNEADVLMQERLSHLKLLLAAFASDAEQCLIASTRYTHHERHDPAELVGVPRVVRFAESLLPELGHKRWRRRVAWLTGVLLVLAFLFYMSVWSASANTTPDRPSSWIRNHEACEFQHFACSRRPHQYVCTEVEPGEQTIAYNTSASASCPEPAFEWGVPLMGRTCYATIEEGTGTFALPLPFLFVSSVAFPIGLFRNNYHRTTINKCILWTPTVPLIFLQCFLRFIIISSLVATSHDKDYARIVSVESFMLIPQVAVFLLMDAMCTPMPKLRVFYALALGAYFLAELYRRSIRVFPWEQVPLLEPGPVQDALMGAGSSSKQSTLASIDWTILVMLTNSILSVVLYPDEMAVVRLRCDTKGYFTWRDQYIGAMAVRAHRRDLDAADRYLWISSKTDRLVDNIQRRIYKAKRRLRGQWNVSDRSDTLGPLDSDDNVMRASVAQS